MVYLPPPPPPPGAGAMRVSIEVPDTTEYRSLIYGHILELADVASYDDTTNGGAAALKFETAIENITYTTL